jgi:methylmalonyl-CoA epimerase
MPHLEHIGIAVDEVDVVIDTFRQLLGCEPYKAETVSSQQVRTHFLEAGRKLELLESLAPDSAVRTFLDRRGEGLHHLAFEVDDLEATMERLRSADFTLLSDTPQPGADDKQIVFVHPKETHGVLVEFCSAVSPPNWTPDTVAHGTRTTAYYEQGPRAAPCLLVLHGAAGSTRHDTAPLLRRLAPHYHVVGVDLCGHGASPLPADHRLTMDRFAADVDAALTAVDRTAAHVFGFSLGSAVALQYAHDHPDRVDRLALLGPNATWTRDQVDAMQHHYDLNRLRTDAPERAAQLERRHRQPERLLAALRAYVDTLPAQNDATRELLRATSPPTLVAGFDADPMFSVEDTTAVHEALPNARLALLPSRAHRLTDPVVDLVVPLLRQHLSRAAPQG